MLLVHPYASPVNTELTNTILKYEIAKDIHSCNYRLDNRGMQHTEKKQNIDHASCTNRYCYTGYTRPFSHSKIKRWDFRAGE